MTEKCFPVTRFDGARLTVREEMLAVEEPLEIRLVHGPATRRLRQRLSVTLRTPGHDEDLARGLLFSEGIIAAPGDILTMACDENILRVELSPNVDVDFEKLARTFASTGSCGLCGKTMIEALETECASINSQLQVPLSVIQGLTLKLRNAQPAFECTGGLHAAALFDVSGDLLSVREDVGRHNAVDKVLGAALGRSMSANILLVSGRAGFELVQKAARFGVPVMVAVGAPTPLAVELAGRTGLTLVGFVREDRGNIYTHNHRIGGM